jgi:hypothetical protein
MKTLIATIVAALATSLAAPSNAQVLFETGSDNGFFTPFNAANAATVKYADSGWLGNGPGSPPVALGRITLLLATYGGNGLDSGTTDIEFTLNDGDPSGLVFGSGAVLFSTIVTDVKLPPSTSLEASFFAVTIDLPGVSTTGNFNNVGWSVKLRNYNYSGSFGFQVATCNAQYVGFYTNNASFFNGTSWSLFAFGPNTCTQIAQFAAIIEAPQPVVCPADLNGDGSVDGQDLGILLGAWGPCESAECPADLNLDGAVNGQDLGILLGAWGPCA